MKAYNHLVRDFDGSFILSTPMGLPLARFYDRQTLAYALEGMAKAGQEVRDKHGRIYAGDVTDMTGEI